MQQTITLSVEGIDRPAQTITVKGSEGHLVSFRVRDPTGLQDLNIGDTVDIKLMRGAFAEAGPSGMLRVL